MQLNLSPGIAINLLCNAFVSDRELKLIGLYRGTGILRVVAGLYHLALIRLEDEPFALEVVDIPLVGALTIYKAELEEYESHQSQEHDAHYGCNHFSFCRHNIVICD